MLFNEKMLAGLGRGIVSTGKLDPEAVTRSMEEFRRFRALSDQAGAEHMYVLATAAAREAVNGPDFIHRAEEVLKTEIRVIGGRQEAYYSALGVISGFHPANGIAGDLGGGSLELVDVNGEAIGDGINAAVGWPAPAGHGEELAGPGGEDRARRTGEGEVVEGWARQALLRRGRNLAKSRPAAHGNDQLSAWRDAPL